ncbi:hypothetical protein BGZ73_000095 [Actinomortierella ambigua]|nr:hypothetical protein BGZ73_000095 [Actinomortierella ambigua]
MISIHPSSSVLTPPQSPKSSAAAMVASTDSTATNGNTSPLTHILVLYQKATSAFLLRQLSVAFSTCLEAQELLSRTNLDYGLDMSDNLNTRRSYLVLKQKLWILHVSVFGAMLSERHQAEQQGLGIHTTTTTNGRKRLSGSSAKDNPEKLVKDLWRRLVEDYGGVEGDVDGQVVVPFVVLCINQKLLTLARQITEAYLSTMPEGLLIHLEAAAGALTTAADPKDPLMTTYERLAELYVIHVLAKLGEWDYARQFLSYNTIISVSSKKAYSKIIDKLHQKSLRPKKKKATTATETKAKVDHHGSRGADSAGSPSFGSPASLSGESVGTSSSAPSGMSTMVSSPVLKSEMAGSTSVTDASFPGLSANSNGSSAGGAGVSAGSTNGKASGTTVSRPIKTRSVGNRSMATVGSSSSSASSSGSQLATIQNKVWIVVQHYAALVRQASAKMGTQQLMMVVAMVVFLGAMSRNRERVSRVVRTATMKVMQTIKMGTTVTSL